VEGKFVSYLRVSTKRQGISGLGLDSQRHSVNEFLNGGQWLLVEEFVEVESGKRNDRPQLAKALSACRIHGATLVVAKIDRLARNAAFLLNLQAAGVEFVACDMPSANRLVVSILASVAEEEGRMISARTRAALMAAKRRGVLLGTARNLTNAARRKGSKLGAKSRTEKANRRANDLQPLIEEIRSAGIQSATAMTKELNARRIPTAWNRGAWTVTQVSRLLARLAA
jgi:DNA invertase Pin-like site-specific DNA recombinase